MNTVKCWSCNDEHYVVLGCCNGRECGCMGGPVAIMKCPDCNPDGKKEPLGAALEYSKYLEEV